MFVEDEIMDLEMVEFKKKFEILFYYYKLFM